MNFLGHFYLSHLDPELLVGNFLGDFVKGKDLSRFRPQVQAGIRLHRYIDDYSDHHPMSIESRRLLAPLLGHYAAVAVDLFYDHFLAKGWENYSSIPLEKYEAWCYRQLASHQDQLNRRALMVSQYMSNGKWLSGYSTVRGIQATFEGMSQRANYENRLAEAMNISSQGYNELRGHFTDFLPDICQRVGEISESLKQER